MGILDIDGIRLQGAVFESVADLTLLPSNKEPALGLVYGKNGSGKSTISLAFSKVSGQEEESISLAAPLDSDGNEVVLTESEKALIHVFNENYVDKNIKLRPDGKGLETIVVFGKDIAKEEQIEIARKTYMDQLDRTNQQKDKCSEYCDAKNYLSPYYHRNKMMDALRGGSSWASRDSKIKGNITASSVYKDTFKRFVKEGTNGDRDSLLTQFNEKLNNLQDARTGKNRIEKEVDFRQFEAFNYDEVKYLNLISKVVERPVLSEREKYLLSLREERGEEHTEQIKEFFMSPEHNRCPFCLQMVSDDYKKDLFASIERALGEEVDRHVEELDELYIKDVAFDFDPFNDLQSNVVDNSRHCLEELNSCIAIINQTITKKRNGVYTPILNATCDINQRYKDFVESLKQLEKARVAHNESASKTSDLINELNKLNENIAWLDIRDEYYEYIKREEEKAKNDELYVQMNQELESYEKKLAELEQSKEGDPGIALDQINHDLSYIFFSKDRLSIELQDDNYILKSRNKPVAPKNISVGERNAVALAYFFSEIMRKQLDGEVYSKNYLLVIDDPVSSFDVENRVGIMSFLDYQLNRFVLGNQKTRVIILTHDLQTSYDIKKTFEGIVNKCKVKKPCQHILYQELENRRLETIGDVRKRSYSQLMVSVYKYANNEAPEYDLIIGNAMRRIMEAYGTFMYHVGIQQFSNVQGIEEKMGKLMAEHFKNFLFRLVLHGDSHSEEKAMSLSSEDFIDSLTIESKQRTAKELIVFLYSLDKYHVLTNLKKDLNDQPITDAEMVIESWKTEVEAL